MLFWQLNYFWLGCDFQFYWLTLLKERRRSKERKDRGDGLMLLLWPRDGERHHFLSHSTNEETRHQRMMKQRENNSKKNWGGSERWGTEELCSGSALALSPLSLLGLYGVTGLFLTVGIFCSCLHTFAFPSYLYYSWNYTVTARKQWAEHGFSSHNQSIKHPLLTFLTFYTFICNPKILLIHIWDTRCWITTIFNPQIFLIQVFFLNDLRASWLSLIDVFPVAYCSPCSQCLT